MTDFDKREWLIVTEWDSCDSGCNTQEYMNYTIREAVEDVCSDIPEDDMAEITLFIDDEIVAIADGNLEGYFISSVK